mmetsp:Transcript_137350/g.347978  ORF Transcript_137350/g.347978 Transcript_137350/m.347978 type:complete len:213 (+) Transcript_137350:63-701(+)
MSAKESGNTRKSSKHQLYMPSKSRCKPKCTTHGSANVTNTCPKSSARDTSWLHDTDAVLASDDAGRRHAREETVVNDAHGGLQLLPRSHRVLDGLCELQVHNVVPVVRDCRLVSVRLVVGHIAQAQHWLATGKRRELGDLAHRVLMAEGHDLHRHWEAGPKAIANLGLIDNHDELFRAHLHDLLAEQSATSTLDQVQRGVHLVGTIDRHIQV